MGTSERFPIALVMPKPTVLQFHSDRVYHLECVQHKQAMR